MVPVSTLPTNFSQTGGFPSTSALQKRIYAKESLPLQENVVSRRTESFTETTLDVSPKVLSLEPPTKAPRIPPTPVKLLGCRSCAPETPRRSHAPWASVAACPNPRPATHRRSARKRSVPAPSSRHRGTPSTMDTELDGAYTAPKRGSLQSLTLLLVFESAAFR